MASPSCPAQHRRKSGESQRSLLALADDLLEEIFVRVGSPADLVRASTACVAFRRLIATSTFLRRYRSLHPPLLLGILYLGYRSNFQFQAVVATHANAPLGDALASAADFSFSYLPPHRWYRWIPCDVRDGRVLLLCGFAVYNGGGPDLAVCDPLSRQYLLLPPIPDGLLASVQVQKQDLIDLEAFFVPSRDMDETSFEVMCRAHSATESLVFVFSSASGRWRCTCTSWNSLSLNVTSDDTLFSSPQCQWAHGCCYWKLYMENKLLKLDAERMEFSTVDLPPDHDDVQCVIVEAEEGKIAMFSHSFGGTLVHYYTFFQNDGEKANVWHLKNSIPLPVDYKWNIENAAAEGYIFLVGTPKYYGSSDYSPVLSLKIKTFTLERLSKITNSYDSIYSYFGFPPSMSPRRIQGDEVLQG